MYSFFYSNSLYKKVRIIKIYNTFENIYLNNIWCYLIREYITYYSYEASVP